MKKRIISFLMFFLLSFSPVWAIDTNLSSPSLFKLRLSRGDENNIKTLLYSQVKYANKTKFDKFISTYDKSYKNADGFDYNTYSNIVKDVWNTYDNIKYCININNIKIDGDNATVDLIESSSARVPVSKEMNGILKSHANSIYYLKKINGKWKVVSDKTIDEVTSMMYGEAAGLDVKLTAPKEVTPGYEYTASLEFTPPPGTLAIASISRDLVEYPQGQPKEVYRNMPEDNLLERLFIANNEHKNEYVIASIGLTKADICDLSIKVSLAGFGYHIIRVNVKDSENNVKNQ